MSCCELAALDGRYRNAERSGFQRPGFDIDYELFERLFEINRKIHYGVCHTSQRL